MWLRFHPHSIHQWFKPKRVAVIEACVIGVVSGLAAVLLKQGIGWVGGWRIHFASVGAAWYVLPLVGAIGGGLAGWLVQKIAPEAAGSGIPQVKAALAYAPMPLNLRIAATKLVGTMLTVGSGLTLGRQGPTVQIGAALATWLSRWIPTSAEYRRQLIAAGAAAGLAAGFNAPIAGVLFVVEEFLQDFSGLTLGTAILASFVGAVVSRLLGGEGLSPSIIDSGVTFSLLDIPFFLLMGVLAGVLGGWFNRGLLTSLRINQKIRLSLPGQVALAGLITGIITLFLPLDFRDNTGLREFLVSGDLAWNLTLLAFVSKFGLTLIAYGSGAPGGLFAPALIIGSALGGLVGHLAVYLEAWGHATWGLPAGVSSVNTFALAGMGAFFSGVTRVPITAIVIVFEMTTDFRLVLPLMIGAVIAYLIADRIEPGSIYTRLLARSGLELAPPQQRQSPWAQLSAAEVMQRRVETLSSDLRLRDVIEAFSKSHHRGFPVLHQGRLVGIISQSDVSEATEQLQSGDTPLADVMTANPVTVSSKALLPEVLYLLNRYKISRLPVVEANRVVGIITRADIIRAESDQLSGKADQLGPQPTPSYLVYQTRSPALGRGKILLPLANPESAPRLIHIALAIARDRNYELECVQIIEVPRHAIPSETLVDTTVSRALLSQAETLAVAQGIPIHTQIRVAHEAVHALLYIIKQRHIDMVLMGWKGDTSTPDRVFGNVADTMIRQAACEVLLVKVGNNAQWQRWLIPVAGGPDALYATQFVGAIATPRDQAEAIVCQVFPAKSRLPKTTTGMVKAMQALKPVLGDRVLPLCRIDDSVSDAILHEAKHYAIDVILMGVSREGLLRQVVAGNIPEQIARQSPCTVVLVRAPLDADADASAH